MPVIAILVSGRPLIIEKELALSNAFVAAWLPGSEGRGVADLLFGDFDFQGRLSFSWPENDDQVSSTDTDTTITNPLFPLGYGLTYKS